MTKMKEIEAKMRATFPRSDLGYKIAKVDKTNRKAKVQPKINPKALMNRFDELFGIDGWKVCYVVTGNIVVCKLSVRIEDDWSSKDGVAQFTESHDEALANAAVKFGIGRQLLDQPDIFVDIKEKKPENSTNEVHYYHSDEISGWWEEPDNPTKESSENPTVISNEKEPDYSKLTLQKKLDYLLSKQIITKKKFDNYFKKINDQTTAAGLLRYFERQFDLLYKLFALAGLNKMSDDTRATIYKRIMSSKMADFTVIDNELKTLEAA